jgi:phenylacetate-CoA ligase
MTTIPIWKDILMTLEGIAYYRFFLHKTQFWSKQQIEAYQFSKLKKLLKISGQYVPYYRELFSAIKFDVARDFRSLNDMEKIPLLTKKEARANKDKLINPLYRLKSFPMRTSGSTGEPFEVMVSFNAWVVEQAVVWRNWIWGGYRFRDQMAIVRSYSPKLGDPLIKHDSLRNFTYYSPFHLNDEMLGIYLDDMIKRKTKIIRGYPSSVFTLAEFVKRTGAEIPDISMILTASEVLTDAERELVENVMKARISNHYGLAEVCVMMGDCEKHEGLHNYDEYGYLELLPSGIENFRSVIGTNLHNFAMPLIRYETGDMAELADKACSCGRSLQTIKNIAGRKDVSIQTPEDYKIPTVNFYTMFENMSKVKKWQIIQRQIDYLEVIVHSDYTPESFLSDLQDALKQRVPSSMRIDIIVNQPFFKVNEGKLNTFISLIKK